MNLSDAYLEICERMNERGVVIKNQLQCFDIEAKNLSPKFTRDEKIEKHCHINFDRKVRFIENKYWSGIEGGYCWEHKPVYQKQVKCISLIVKLDKKLIVYIDNSRLFPTLYIDLYVISKMANLYDIETIDLHIAKVAINWQILLMDRALTFKPGAIRQFANWSHNQLKPSYMSFKTLAGVMKKYEEIYGPYDYS